GISGGLIAITDQSKQLATGKDGATAVAGVDRDVTTESAAAKAGALTKGWDAQQLQKDVDAQIAITQEFSKQAPRAIAQFADDKVKALNKQAALTQDETTRKEILAEAKKWGEEGMYRVALHTVSGGLTGGLGGALGAGAVADNAKLLDDMQDKLAFALQEKGLSPETAKMFAQGVAEATSLGIGAAAGGIAGAGSAFAVDTNNRQLTSPEQKLLQKKAKEIATSLAQSPADAAKIEAYWYSMLSLAADVKVDSQAAKNLNTYLANLSAAAQKSGNDQTAEQFVASFAKASAYVQQMAGQSILDKNSQPIVADGTAVKTFVSTSAQSNDQYLFGGGITGMMATVAAFGSNKDKLNNSDWYSIDSGRENSAVNNKIEKLQEFLLERTSASNGSAVSICPECNLIGVNLAPFKGAFQFGRVVAIDAGELVIKDVGGDTISSVLNGVDSASAGTFTSETIPRNGSRIVIDQRYVSEVGDVACGPTACAMVLNDSGNWVNITQIAQDAGLVPGVGTDVVGLARTLKNNGLASANWKLGVTVDDLATATANGNAAIARVTLGNGEGHFVVVDGVTTRQGQSVVAVRDPGTGTQYFVPKKEFAKSFSGQVVFTR
ncbi:MAG: cysteine peptidase family C39 domain-containing protein, partial [Pseudomonadota bacterium]